MFFRVLGPVELLARGRPVDLGPQRQRALLAVLLFSPRRVVPAATLIDRIWGASAPASVRNTLYSYVTRLRRVLEGVSASDSPPLLVSRGGGYVLDVDPELVDLHRFRALLGQARQADADDASVQLSGEALGLWTDNPLANVSGDWLAGQREALCMEQLSAIAEHADALARLGRGAELVPELAATLEAHPLSEPIAVRLIRALRGGGRRAEALAYFARTRARIADELGAEPGAELRSLHLELLRDDAEPRPPVRREDPPPTNLPSTTGDFTGRAGELAALLAYANHATPGVPTVVAVNGLAGVGKTSLALHAAHRLLDQFPDAHLFVDLCGHTADRGVLSAEEALDTLLRCLGVPAAEMPARLDERVALWRTQLHRRRALVVLDNAVTVEQLQPLLPSSGDALVLITSRQRLIGLAGAQSLSLDPFTETDAARFFERIAGRDRVQGEIDAVSEVLALCGYLPLALRIAAARLHHRQTWTVAHLLARLRDQSTPLAELAYGDRGVAASLHLSYTHLSPDQQRMFRLSGLVPGNDLDAYAGAALVERKVPEARKLLEDLVDANLLHQQHPDRYRAHDLVRDYARHLTDAEETPDGKRHAFGRLLDFYRRGAYLANGRITTRPAPFDLPDDDRAPTLPDVRDRAGALAWFDQERANLIGAVRLAATAGWPEYAWQITSRLWYFLDLRWYTDDWIATQRVAIGATQASGDLNAESIARYSLGIAYRRSGRYRESIDELRHVRALGAELGNERRQADALNSLGAAYMHIADYAEAHESLRQARALYHRIGDDDGETMVILNLGERAMRTGEYAAAAELGCEAVDRSLRTGAAHLRVDALLTLAEVRFQTGEPKAALAHYRDAATLALEIGNPGLEARAVNGIARLTSAAGDLAGAVAGHLRALAQLRELGDLAGQAEVCLGMGDSYRAHSATPEAEQHYRQALALARQIRYRHLETRAEACLAALA
ncbi:AfsR/SARP family transcriptional regulator [Tenggerimyces flavus]|uniref:BTAD domain-containing putative transcriptional regulator n=1 Tax=Tenggerimyces flavus TaxID=1708749 RepID=A0ABV7Y8R2_9ACTN|nr:BTAD domain-containing putative transcriptional regulator [Tenggerimyces flavus]MBM7790972.1 DNA-binding SARP family transcriptional activator [Tenggerimyces flavus]